MVNDAVTKSTTASPSLAEISYDSFCNQSEFDETFFSSPPKGNKALKDAGNAPLEISSSRPRDRRLSKEWGTLTIMHGEHLTLEHHADQTS